MRMKPNKTGLVCLLRAQGYDVPSVGSADFEALWQAMALHWRDSSGRTHTAYLYLSTVTPALQVDRETMTIPAEEITDFGLVEKQEAPCAAEADTRGNHEDTIMIAHEPLFCKG